MLPSRWFWPVFSRNTEYRDIKKQFRWPKKDSNKCCASYKIISATTEWMLKTKIFEKKLTFPTKKNNSSFFSRNTQFCRRPWQFYHAPQSIQANLVQVKRSILKDLIICWKRSILKKRDEKANIPRKKS